MFRENKPPTEELHIFLNSGGLGDDVGALPAVLHAAKMNTIVTVWCKKYLLDFARTILPSNINVDVFDNIEKRNKHSSAVQMLSSDHTPMRRHLTDYACSILLDKDLPIEEKNYLSFPVDSVDVTKFNLPEKFIAITCGYTAPVRELLPQYINEIVQFIKSKGYDVVFLGNDKALTLMKYDDGTTVSYKGNFSKDVDYSAGLNLINQTSLSEATAVMSKAKAVVGLDNGLLHLAGCTEVAIVGGFTTVNPIHRMPYRHNELGWNYYSVVPPESLACRFCQSHWSFVYDHPFTKCYYRDYKCLYSTEAKLYIDQLIKIL